jgi:hypothetical protein
MNDLAEVADMISFEPHGPADSVKTKKRTISYKNKYAPKSNMSKKIVLNPD